MSMKRMGRGGGLKPPSWGDVVFLFILFICVFSFFG